MATCGCYGKKIMFDFCISLHSLVFLSECLIYSLIEPDFDAKLYLLYLYKIWQFMD